MRAFEPTDVQALMNVVGTIARGEGEYGFLESVENVSGAGEPDSAIDYLANGLLGRRLRISPAEFVMLKRLCLAGDADDLIDHFAPLVRPGPPAPPTRKYGSMSTPNAGSRSVPAYVRAPRAVLLAPGEAHHAVSRWGATREARYPLVREWRSTLLLKGVSASMAAKSHCLLRAALMTAVKEDNILRVNPCRIPGPDKETPEERPVLTVPQVFQLADAVPGRYRAFILVSTFACLRWGEASALQRQDIDLARGTVRVRQAFTGQRGRVWCSGHRSRGRAPNGHDPGIDSSGTP